MESRSLGTQCKRSGLAVPGPLGPSLAVLPKSWTLARPWACEKPLALGPALRSFLPPTHWGLSPSLC